jgi:hypothetical protein
MKVVKIYKITLVSIISIHFFIVILLQCYQQKWTSVEYSILDKLESFYMLPFFEQNWSMFSPNPPTGKKYIALEFYTKKNNEKNITSSILNIHDPISKENLQTYFSLNQRLIKYFVECSNEIIIKSKTYKTPKELNSNSNAFRSIKNYSKFVLFKQKEFLNKINTKDSVFMNLFIVSEVLPSISEQDKNPEKYFQKIENIFLTKKDSLNGK